MLRENAPVMFTIHFAVSALASPSLKANLSSLSLQKSSSGVLMVVCSYCCNMTRDRTIS